MRDHKYQAKFLGLGVIICCGLSGSLLFAAPSKALPTSRPSRHAGAERYMEQIYRQSDGRIDWGGLQNAIRQRHALMQQSLREGQGSEISRGLSANNGWTSLGPGNIGGRVIAIYVDASSPQHILLGTAGGGIWNTTNGGTTWAPVNDFMGSLAVSAIVRDPVTGTLYAGTGEFDAGDGMRGAGIFQSTDNGVTWTALVSTNPGSNQDWLFVNSLAVNATGIMLAATWNGVYRTSDGGNTWTKTYTGLSRGVAFDPNNAQNAIIDESTETGVPIATDNSVIGYSTNGGQTWTRVTVVQGSVNTFTVNSPAAIAKTYTVGGATFNPTNSNVTNNIVEVKNSSGALTDGCTAPFANAAAVSGNIALLERGTCAFTQKVQNAQSAGATGVIVVDNQNEPVFTMGGTPSSTISVPGFLISMSDGSTIENSLATSAVNSTMSVTTNPNGGGGRTSLAYAPSVPGTVYASVDYQLGTIFKSADGGKTWIQQAVVQANGENLFSISIGGDQGWYDDPLWVDPTNANHLVAGGIDLWQSTDGGSTWVKISDWTNTPTSPHADHHALAADPGYNGTSDTLFFDGDDGGIYKTSDILTATTTSGWTFLVNGLGDTQFYSVAGLASAISSSRGGIAPIIGGAQDNGCESYIGNPNGWLEFFGGDGGYTAVDPLDSNTLYCEYTNLQLTKSTDGGQSASYIKSGITDAGTNANFIAPFILDPNNDNTLLAGGASLWRSTNVKSGSPPTWASISGTTLPSNASTQDFISAIAVATGKSDDIWVGFNDGSVWQTVNGTQATPAWTQVAAATLPASAAVERIAIDPSDINSVYVLYGGFGNNNLWHSTDGGTTWANLSAGLPSAPMFDLAIIPASSGSLYLATEVGIYTSTDGGSTWGTTNQGPANVRVVQLDWFDSTHLLAATYGRGMWELNLANVSPAPTVSSLSPVSATAGGAAFTLTVNGTGFASTSVVNFNSTALTTTFVSGTQLTASVPVSAIATAGTANVTVTTPAPGGGTSSAQTFVITNPVPTVSSLSPASAIAGSAPFTLSVNGTGFVSTSVVNFNGTILTTTFVSATQLTASVPASVIAAAGMANVTVTTSAPGGGTSSAQTFTIQAASSGGGGGGGIGIFALSLIGLAAIRKYRKS